MDVEVLNVVLKRLIKETNIQRVLDVEAVPALPKGENYTSKILRLKLKVVLGNGRLANKSLIMKQVITKEETGKWLHQINVAKSEAEIYSVIHKEMRYLMHEFEDTDETLWCKFIYYDFYSSSLLLEDLKVSGYMLVPRQKGLDLEHAILALRGLGRYHGMAKVLEERGFLSKDIYKPCVLLTDENLMKCFLFAGIRNTSTVIRENWGPGWEETADNLIFPFETFKEKLLKLAKYEESAFTVLNHGDCWSNNMMFKYDWRGRPVSVKFVDYQFPHYNTPCIDITNFIYFSIQPAIRRTNYCLLLESYHDSLDNSLGKFGYTGSKPTLEEISSTMDRLSFFGLSLFVCCYACIVCSSTEAMNLDKLLETNGEEGFNAEILKEPGMAEKMGPDIKDFVQKHLII